MTLPEVLLWRLLRRRPQGLKFRRQHPAGPYVLDFYCESAKVAIEVDGAIHGMGDLPANDLARDRWLAEAGIRTFRISAKDVLENEDGGVTAIIEQCSQCQTPPPRSARSPSPSGRI